MTSTYPPQGLELQQLPHPFAVDDDNDQQQRWREAYHRRLNGNTDPIPQLEQQTDNMPHPALQVTCHPDRIELYGFVKVTQGAVNHHIITVEK